MMKEVVMSALSNSRLIRDELTGIRNELSKTPKPATVLPPAPQTPNPVTSGTEVPVFKSVRVLLGPGVTSPIAMDRFIDDLTAGKGRNAIRLCVAQQTLHPKAFVIVAAVDNLSIEEWQSRIVNSFYVYAWDRAFPLYQSTMPGLPWEIRVKNGMSSIIPQWIYVGPHAAYNSSLG
jgi:hypothetical protein